MPIIKEERLNPYDPSSFDPVKGEVTDAMQFDWKRDMVDDAKKRAIYQASNYDDFKQRVAGCTLKPIHRHEFNVPPKYVFNRQGSGGYSGALQAPGAAAPRDVAGVLGGAAAVAAASKPGAKVPRTAHEFERELRRRVGASERVALLEQLDGDAYSRLFGREMDAEVLRQLVLALEEAAVPGAARRFLTEVATRCPSSATAASSFFGPKERNLVARLLARDGARAAEDDVRICAALGVPPSAVAACAVEGGEGGCPGVAGAQSPVEAEKVAGEAEADAPGLHACGASACGGGGGYDICGGGGGGDASGFSGGFGGCDEMD